MKALLLTFLFALQAAPTPVIIELFTSEGCSSCPPADQILIKLASQQPVRGVRIIALGEHVDYWDHQGWRDPFSSKSFTARQTEYANRLFGTDRIYTPQLVVDGETELIGSDESSARRAIERAARRQKATIDLSFSEASGVAAVRVTGLDASKRRDADLVLAVTEDGLRSDVKRGENTGLTLTHAAVVRWMSVVSRVPRDRPAFTGEFKVPLDPAWPRDRIHVIAFLQERDSRRVLAAETIKP